MDDTSGEVTPFLGILDIFSSRVARAHGEAAVTVSVTDLSFVQNLSEAEKLSILFEVTYNMYQELC